MFIPIMIRNLKIYFTEAKKHKEIVITKVPPKIIL